jgi:hypothetical protein
MYLDPSELRALLAQLGGALDAPESRIWLDHVTPRILASKERYAADFFSTMARMGEPFRSGFDELEAIVPDAWGVAGRSSAAEWLGLQDDEVHEGYTFAVLQPAADRVAGRGAYYVQHAGSTDAERAETTDIGAERATGA